MSTIAKELSSSDISGLDIQITKLMQCKPIKEIEVKFLCDKVILSKKG